MTYQPSASPNLYLSGLAASGISGYKQLAKPPLAAAVEINLTQAVVDTDGEVLMQSWVSAALGLTEIAAGDWLFNVFGYVDTVDGASEIVIRVYSHNAAGSETELFDVTTGSLTGSAAGYIVSSSQSVCSLGALTDRLVVKFYAKTTSTGTRTVHLYYLGAARQSRMVLPVELAIVPGGDMLASLYDSDADGQIGGSGGHTIQDEGTDLPAQVYLNFKGAGATVTNNTETGSSDVEIPGATIDPWISSADTWSYSSADSPTFVISVNADMTGLIGVGYRIRLTQTTVKYFIVTAIGAYSGGATLITVYGGTDYTLANAAVTSPAYSFAKAPLGFPMDTAKWTVLVTDTTQRAQGSPGNGTWYNLGTVSITLPIGSWVVTIHAKIDGRLSSAGGIAVEASLSTANNSESDANWTVGLYAGEMILLSGSVEKTRPVTVASKTVYYLIERADYASGTNLYLRSDTDTTVVRAVCAFL